MLVDFPIYSLDVSIIIFLQVHNWKDQYGGTILRQLRTLGASLDWSREVKSLSDSSIAIARESNISVLTMHSFSVFYNG